MRQHHRCLSAVLRQDQDGDNAEECASSRVGLRPRLVRSAGLRRDKAPGRIHGKYHSRWAGEHLTLTNLIILAHEFKRWLSIQSHELIQLSACSCW